MENIAEKMKLIVKKYKKTEEEDKEEVKRFGKQKKDKFWEKLNEDTEKEAEKIFKNILCQIKIKANKGKGEILVNIGKDRENKYVARDSKTMLDEVCDEETRDLNTGIGMNIDRCFDSAFESSCDIKLNLLAEKLIDLIKKDGFKAQKYLSEYTEDGGWEDIKGPSFTWHGFGIKIYW